MAGWRPHVFIRQILLVFIILCSIFIFLFERNSGVYNHEIMPEPIQNLQFEHLDDNNVKNADLVSGPAIKPGRKFYNESTKHTFARMGLEKINVNIAPDEHLYTILLKDSDLYNSQEQTNEHNLLSGLIPLNVHYFWCGHSWFEFKHYLSIMSVIRFLLPDKIVFHYEHPPVVDNVFYHQWMDNLIHDYPFLVLEQLTGTFCTDDRERQIDTIMRILNVEGGLYTSLNTWMMKLSTRERLADIEFALEKDTIDGFILHRAALQYNLKADLLNPLPGHNKSSNYKISRTSCLPVHLINQAKKLKTCMIVRDGNYSTFYPMNIWELDTAFGRLSRRIFYGTSKIRRPQPSYDSLVPNIGHMVWNGGGDMNFVFYLSVLSLLYVANVEKVFIHGNAEPKGEYWQNITQREKGKVEFILRTPPQDVFLGKIEPWFLSLMSDIVRVDVMIKYGGIYTDTDAIWVKPLTVDERAYDVTANFDWIDWSYPFPDSVNFGISYGKKDAPFWRLFRDSMRTLHNNSPGFTGVQMPYKLLEKYPHLLRIDRHLSVICYEFRCHPNWVEGYHDITKNHLTMNSIPNWREDVHAFHWTHPNPPELKDFPTLMRSTGLFADIGKNVLIKAGIIKDIE